MGINGSFRFAKVVGSKRCLTRAIFRYISGAGDPRTKVHLVLGKSDPDNSNTYKQQSVVIVPADTPGVKVVRQMKVMGYDDAPEGHSEIIYDNVHVPLGNLVLGWGRGFEVRIATWICILGLCFAHSQQIIQGRLGPGRIHHCMRSIGAARVALDSMIRRVTDPSRKTFGKSLHEHGRPFSLNGLIFGYNIITILPVGTVVADIAKSTAEIESARLLVLSAALQVSHFPGHARRATC
jgi:acyl-CoA dehydrogenase